MGQRIRYVSSALVALMLAVLGTVVMPAPAQAEGQDVPIGGALIIGRGFGHGIGMSQYGAYGAASKGLTWTQIMAFYYPGTAVFNQGNPSIRIALLADTDNVTEVFPAAGLTLVRVGGLKTTLPTSVAVTTVSNGVTTTKQVTPARWRATRLSAGYVFSFLDSAAGVWRPWAPAGSSPTTPQTSPVTFANPTSGQVRLWISGVARAYPDAVAATVRGTGSRTINVTTFERYVAGVVPGEMPASWATEALRSQAVAARTYAAYEKAHPRFTGADTCDTTSCQVYSGLADYTTGGTLIRNRLDSRATAATQATAGRILTYQGSAALAMFSSANGGWTQAGSLPYLVAKSDPYDGAIPNSAHA